MLHVHLWLVSIVQYVDRILLLLVTSASDLPLHTIKSCSVVFGITLRLIVINTSSSSRVNNKGILPLCLVCKY